MKTTLILIGCCFAALAIMRVFGWDRPHREENEPLPRAEQLQRCPHCNKLHK